MKIIHPFSFGLLTAIGFLVWISTARAEIIPVSEDTFSVGGFLNKGNGNAGTLMVTPTESTFLKFPVTNAGIAASDVASARLILYFTGVTAAGNVDVETNSADFSESPPVKKAQPGQGSGVLASIPVTIASKKSFVELDVTATVQAWLATGTNFGFALKSTNGARVTLASRENPAMGFPALLEVEAIQHVFDSGVGLGTTNLDRPLAINGLGVNGEWISLQDTNGITRWHMNNFGNGLNFAQTEVADFRLFLSTNGNVGINTRQPTAPLTVNGNIAMGSNSSLTATGSQETLRIVRGIVGSGGLILTGSGFDVQANGSGSYTITFQTPFSDGASVTVTGLTSPAITPLVDNAEFQVQMTSHVNDDFSFIAIGPP